MMEHHQYGLAFDLNANLRRLLDEAPPTRCGRCRHHMTAESVDVTVTTHLDWPEWRDGTAQDFTPAYTDLFACPSQTWTYSGKIEYQCKNCGNMLYHVQRVSLDASGFHFQPPEETR